MIHGNVMSLARPFSSTAASPKAPTVGALFAGSGHTASSRLAYRTQVFSLRREQVSCAVNKNGRTLNTVFPNIMGMCNPEIELHIAIHKIIAHEDGPDGR